MLQSGVSIFWTEKKHENVDMIVIFCLILKVLTCVFPSSANLFSTNNLINYVSYDDQEYAENKYLEMGPMRNLRKLLYKPVPVNDSSVCNMTDADVTQICDEIARYRRSRNMVSNPYKTQEDELPEGCKEYTLKLAFDHRLEKKIEKVIARRCPTKPALWMSDGKNVGGVFVYALHSRTRKALKLIDYITFMQRTNLGIP